MPIYQVPVGGNAPMGPGQTHQSANPGGTPGVPNAGAPKMPTLAPPKAPVIFAQEDPTLQAIDKQYEEYAKDLESGTGRILNQATSATRDAFAGLRQQTGEDFVLRGAGGGEALRDIDSETGRTIAGQHAQIARNREEQRLGAYNARNSARNAAIANMQGDKRIGLEGYGAHNQAMQAFNAQNAQNAATQFDQLLAIMNANRSSPSNPGSTFYPGSVGPPLYSPYSENTRGGSTRAVY